MPAEARLEQQSQSAKIRRLKAELKRAPLERDILKYAAALCHGVPAKYASIKSHETTHLVRRLLQMMAAHPCSHYARRPEQPQA